MSAPAFTPGPWNLEGLTAYALNREGTNRFNATVQEGWTAHARTRTGNSELVANVRLIATSPELYAELVSTIEALESVIKCVSPGLAIVLRDRVMFARAALAKAVSV